MDKCGIDVDPIADLISVRTYGGLERGVPVSYQKSTILIAGFGFNACSPPLWRIISSSPLKWVNKPRLSLNMTY
jgi:hypothetical protein